MPYVNHLARQINGPIALSWTKARYDELSKAEEWINHRTNLSLSNATTEELDMIGKILGIPRPYATVEGSPVYAEDEEYVIFILNLTYLKRRYSINAIADMLYQFIPNGQFEITIQSNGDLYLKLDNTYSSYFPYIQKALDKAFNSLPRIIVESRDYHDYVQDGVLYTYYIELDDPDYFFYFNNHTGYVSCTDTDKVSVDEDSHTISLTIERRV